MKRVWIMRHAKSERDDPGLADIDRPLARRGRKDAPAVGQWLAAHGAAPDLIVSSPARRARDTADLVARAVGYQGEPQCWQLLYPGEAEPTLGALRELDKEVGSVLLVTHNPHAEELVALLAAGDGLKVRMPTAALALLEADIAEWTSLERAGMSLAALVAPETL